MTNELRNKNGDVFWSDECADAVEAINFALDCLDDQYDRLDFLVGWREGDVAAFPNFLERVGKRKSHPAA